MSVFPLSLSARWPHFPHFKSSSFHIQLHNNRKASLLLQNEKKIIRSDTESAEVKQTVSKAQRLKNMFTRKMEKMSTTTTAESDLQQSANDGETMSGDAPATGGNKQPAKVCCWCCSTSNYSSSTYLFSLSHLFSLYRVKRIWCTLN
jgi:hypothetical protein